MSIVATMQAVTMTSREIAELTGKQHQHVLHDIRKMLGELKEDESPLRRIYFDSMNRQQTEFALDLELTETLLTGWAPAGADDALKLQALLDQVRIDGIARVKSAPAVEAATASGDETPD